MRGADATMTRVIRRKIVTQVETAILYGGGRGAGLRGQGEPALQPGEEPGLGPHRGGGGWRGALHPCDLLVGLQPATKVGR